jgi:hypothetical protein
LVFLSIKNTSSNKYNVGVVSSGIDIGAKFHEDRSFYATHISDKET